MNVKLSDKNKFQLLQMHYYFGGVKHKMDVNKTEKKGEHIEYIYRFVEIRHFFCQTIKKHTFSDWRAFVVQ